jgi:hypothetical protein
MTIARNATNRTTAATWHRRGDATLRLLAAMPLGYAVASLIAMALARILPMPAAAASMTATLVAFAICAGAAIWAYAASSGWRACWTLAAVGLVAGGIVWISNSAGGRL